MKIAGIFFISVIFALFITEILLRIAGAPSRTLEVELSGVPGIVFMKPNQEYLEKRYKYQPPYKVKINSLGLRDNEIEYNAGYKIFCLGDSFTYGAGIELEDTYVDKLEKRLREKKPDLGIEVINGGTGGSTIDYQLEVFKKKALNLNPNILILQFCTNDILEFNRRRNREKVEKIPKSVKLPFKKWIKRTALYIQLYKIKTHLLSRKQHIYLKKHEGRRSDTKNSFYTLPLSFFWQKAWDEYLVQLQKLAGHCKAYDIKLVILVIPSFEQMQGDEKGNAPQIKLEHFAKKNNAIFVNPLHRLRSEVTENIVVVMAIEKCTRWQSNIVPLWPKKFIITTTILQVSVMQRKEPVR